MKIALLLSGQFRDAKRSFESIKRFILEPYNPDVFISSWLNSKDIVPSGWFGNTPDDDCSVGEIVEMYSPKCIFMENFVKEESGFFSQQAKILDSLTDPAIETKTNNVFSMWYKKHQANQLKIKWEKQNDFKYDLVILSRFDLIFLEDPRFEILNDGKIRIPVGFDWCSGIGDLLVYGNSATMDKYLELFEKMHYYRLVENVSPTPELINKHHIEKSGFNLERWILKYQIREVNIWENPK